MRPPSHGHHAFRSLRPTKKDPMQVRAKDPLPFVPRRLVQWLGRRPLAGIRDEDVDRAELGVEAVEHCRDLRWIADVSLDTERPPPRLTHIPCGLLSAGCIRAVVDGNIGAHSRESPGYAAANAAAGAGDQRVLAIEPDLHGGPSLCALWLVSRPLLTARGLLARGPRNARTAEPDFASRRRIRERRGKVKR